MFWGTFFFIHPVKCSTAPPCYTLVRETAGGTLPHRPFACPPNLKNPALPRALSLRLPIIPPEHAPYSPTTRIMTLFFLSLQPLARSPDALSCGSAAAAAPTNSLGCVRERRRRTDDRNLRRAARPIGRRGIPDGARGPPCAGTGRRYRSRSVRRVHRARVRHVHHVACVFVG